MNKSKLTRIDRTDQRGMASILITMVTMVVISLIVLSFAIISRREQTSTLNQQLSTQAFYAAESGVNDVVNLAKQQAANGHTLPKKDDCANTGVPYSTLNNVIDADNDVSYSCILVDPAPTVLSYGDVDTNSTVVPLKSAGGNISKLTLNWTAKDNSGNPLSGCQAGGKPSLKTLTSWNCGYGVLRFDLVPTAGSQTAAGLQAANMTRFMIPSTSGGSSSIGYAGGPTHRADYLASCTQDNCQLTITGLSSNNYYLRVMSLYHDSSLKISAKDSGGHPLGLEGVQLAIDSTGKAQDVLRRIKVNVSIAKAGQNYFPDNGLQSAATICKRFSTSSDSFENDIPSGITGTDRMCNNGSGMGTGPVGGDPGANFGGCPGSPGCPSPGSGGGNGTKPPISYYGHFVNTTSDPEATASNVASCDWDFGDGSPLVHTACYTGQDLSHEFFPGGTQVPTKCYTYTITLTIHYKGGISKEKINTLKMPGGTKSPCR